MKLNATSLIMMLIVGSAQLLFPAYGQIASKQNGPWEDAGTWNGGTIPANTDPVTIAHTVSITDDITRDATTLIDGTVSGSMLIVNQGGKLRLHRTLNNQGKTEVSGTLELGDGGYAEGNQIEYTGNSSQLIFDNGNNDYEVNPGQAFWPADEDIPATVIIKNKRVILQDDDHSIQNIILQGGLVCVDKIIKVKNTLEIRSNGYLSIGKSNRLRPHPFYAKGSTLIYNSLNTADKSYGIGDEWRRSDLHDNEDGPYHVTVKEKTFVNYRNNIEERTVRGNLTIESTGGLFMDYDEDENEGDGIHNSGPLIVDGHVKISGAFSMGKKYGEDLKLKGNLTFENGYDFYPNKRAVWFLKILSAEDPDPQIVGSPNEELTIPYIVIGDVTDPAIHFNDEKTSAIRILQPLKVDAPNDDRAIRFRSKNDFIEMNGFSLTIGEDRPAISISKATFIDGGGYFKGHPASSLYLFGGGNTGTLRFTPGSQKLNNLIINKHPVTTGGGTSVTGAVLGTPLTLHGTESLLANGILALGSSDLTFEEKASYTKGQGYIDATGSGRVSKVFNEVQDFTFPVGDTLINKHYTPATIQLTALTGKAQFHVSVRKAKHPQNISSANYINRYWNISSSFDGFTGAYKARASFIYHDDDVSGNESSMFTSGFAAPYWYIYLPAQAADNMLTLTGESDLNKSFTGGDQFNPLASSPNDYFRSAQSGDWNNISAWQSSHNQVHWQGATLVPDHESRGIHIQAAHTIGISSPVSLDETLVDGTLQLNTDGILNIQDGPGTDIDIRANGTLFINSQNSYASSIILPVSDEFATGAINVNTGGTILIGNGKNTTGTGYENLAIQNNFRWQDKARFVWNNGRAFPTSGITYFPLPLEKVPIFSVGPTQLEPITSAGILTINGILDVRTDLYFTASTATRVFRDGITGNSILSIPGGTGTQKITGMNAIIGGSDLRISLGKIFRFDSDEMTVTVPKDSSVTFENAGGGIEKAAKAQFIVNGTADMTSINMNNNSGSVTINGHLKTAASDGLKGSTNSTFTSGIINITDGSTIEYNRIGNQTINSSSSLNNQLYYHIIFAGDGIKTFGSSVNVHTNGSVKISGPASLVVNATSNIGPTDANNSTAFTMDGGRLRLGNTGTLPLMEGTYNLTGGVIEFAGNNLTAQTIRPAQYFNIEVTGKTVSNSSGKIEIKPNGSFIVKEGGIYTSSSGNAPIVATNNSANGQVVKVESNATFRTAVTEGFYGANPGNINEKSPSVQNSITHVVLEPGSTIEYLRQTGVLPSSATNGDQNITFNEAVYTYQNLTLAGDGNKTAPALLKMKGDLHIKNDATFKHNNGLAVFNGEAKQRIVSQNNPVFYELENSNASSLQIGPDYVNLNETGYSISIKELLRLTENSKLNLVGGDVTIISDAEGTGRIDNIPSTASLLYYNGRFKIERYIPNHPKAWQLLGINTRGGSIRESWQNNHASTAGRGVNITSPYWTASDSKGFDAYSPAPSMKWHNQETGLFKGITSTENQIDEHPAYFLFVRGDRSVGSPYQPATPVTLHTRGKLFSPDNPPPSILLKPDRWEMLGNPYASTIDFDQLQITGGQLEAAYYIWDPNLTQLTANGGFSEYGLGAYRAVTKVGGNYLAVPPVNPLVPDAPYPMLQSGQGFYVRNVSEISDALISFSEDAKSTGSENVFRTGNVSFSRASRISSNLFVHNNGDKILVDGAMHLFNDEFNPETDAQDAKKMQNAAENISLPGNKYPLIIDRRPYAREGDSLFFLLTGLSKKNYSLQIVLSDMNAGGHEIYLNDRYRQSVQPLYEGINSTDFMVNDDAASAQTDRFYLTFRKLVPPFRFLAEKAESQSEKIRLEWKGENQKKVYAYLPEHSTDEKHFSPLQQVAVSESESSNYTFNHIHPAAGMNYYRIKALLKDGSVVYSRTLSSLFEYQVPSISFYPNPVIDHIMLNFYRQPQGKYHVQIRDSKGRLVKTETFEHAGLAENHRIKIEGFSSGLYIVEIRKPDDTRQFEKIMIK